MGVFIGFARIFFIFKRLTARRLYKSFGVKGLISRSEQTLYKEERNGISLCLGWMA
jgi:hypothetical protein